MTDAPTPAPAPAPAPVFLQPNLRFKTVELQFPLAYNGFEYRRIVIKRISVSMLSEWVERMNSLTDEEKDKARYPMYFDERSQEIPEVIWEYLDLDDQDAVVKAANDFLPERLRATIPSTPQDQDTPSSPQSGDTIVVSSGT